MIMDYMNGLYNPFLRSNTYHVFEFRQDDVMNLARGNDNSVISFFMIVMAKALDKVLPAKDKIIRGESAHNTFAGLGIPNSHYDMLSHVWVDYERPQLGWDMEKLATWQKVGITLVACLLTCTSDWSCAAPLAILIIGMFGTI